MMQYDATYCLKNKFDEEQYNATIIACALDHDIAQLSTGHDNLIKFAKI